jgi:hypothetical protein
LPDLGVVSILILLSLILALISLHAGCYLIADAFNAQMRLSGGALILPGLIRLSEASRSGDDVKRCDLATLIQDTAAKDHWSHAESARYTRTRLAVPLSARRSRMQHLLDAVRSGRASCAARTLSPFGPSRIFSTDACIEGKQVFFVPVKVSGDLEITGNVEFNEALIIDGAMLVRGQATFLGGVLVKGDVVVEGLAIVDSAIQYSWLVARKLRGSGILAISTSVSQHDLLAVAS